MFFFFPDFFCFGGFFGNELRIATLGAGRGVFCLEMPMALAARNRRHNVLSALPLRFRVLSLSLSAFCVRRVLGSELSLCDGFVLDRF